MTGKPERLREFDLRELRAMIAALEAFHDPDREPATELDAIIASLTAECHRALERRSRLVQARHPRRQPRIP